MDARFAVSIQFQHSRSTCPRKMAGSVRKWQEVVGIALTFLF